MKIEAKRQKRSDEKAFTFVATKEILDRHNEIVDVQTMNTDNYMKNPVVYWEHQSYGERPIGKVIDLVKVNGEMFVSIEFNQNNEFANSIKKDVEEGYINAVSIGFIAKEKQGERLYNTELLEISITGIPANPDSLIRKSFISKAGAEISRTNKQKLIAIKENMSKAIETIDSMNIEEKQEEEKTFKVKTIKINDNEVLKYFKVNDTYYDLEENIINNLKD